MGRRDDKLMKDIEKAVRRDITKEPQIYGKDLVDKVKNESKPIKPNNDRDYDDEDEDKKKFSIADIGYRLRFWWSNIHMNIKDGIYFLDSHGVFDRISLGFKWCLKFLIALCKWSCEKVLALGFKTYFNFILMSEIKDQDPTVKDRDNEGVSGEIGLRIKGILALVAVLAVFFSAAEIGWGLTFLVIIALFLIWNGVLYDLRGRNRYQYADAVKFCSKSGFEPGMMIKYVSMPSQLLDIDWAFEDWCDINIVSSKVYKDKHYGWVRKIKVKELDLNRRPFEADTLTDKMLIDFGLIPQSPNGDKASASRAYYVLQDFGIQSLEYLIGGDRGKLIDRIATDPAVAGSYQELADQLEAKKQKEEEEEAKRKEEAEEADLKAYCAEHNLPNGAVGVLMQITKHRSEWGFGTWKLRGDSVSGNDRYFSVRCRFLGNTSIKDVKRIRNQMESAFRRQVLIEALADRGSFKLTVLLNSNLPKYQITMNELKQYGSNDQILIGDSLTGRQVVTWNWQANHTVISGKSGSGKSVEILAFIANLLSLKSFNYKNLIICSSSKIGDFGELAKAGAYVGSGLDECIKCANAVLNECKKREKMFADSGVSNLWEYNKKYPNAKLGGILYVHDELENAVNSADKAKSKQLEGLILEGLNIYRSSGCLFICGLQSPLISVVGQVLSKMTVQFIGNNNKNILNQFDPSTYDYYQTADSSQGRFFIKADNLIMKNAIRFGDAGYILMQTPYVADLKSSNLPTLTGQSFMDQANNDSGVRVENVDADGFVE